MRVDILSDLIVVFGIISNKKLSKNVTRKIRCCSNRRRRSGGCCWLFFVLLLTNEGNVEGLGNILVTRYILPITFMTTTIHQSAIILIVFFVAWFVLHPTIKTNINLTVFPNPSENNTTFVLNGSMSNLNCSDKYNDNF